MNDDLYQSLKARIQGDVRFDRASRLMYSTDASIYEIEPLGVVIPRTHEDVFAAMEIARDFKVPVLPRGGGTSLAGQTVGEAENHERRQVEQWCGLADGEAAVYDQQSEQLRKLGVGRYLGCIAYRLERHAQVYQRSGGGAFGWSAIRSASQNGGSLVA